jgi:hypothetical protein
MTTSGLLSTFQRATEHVSARGDLATVGVMLSAKDEPEVYIAFGTDVSVNLHVMIVYESRLLFTGVSMFSSQACVERVAQGEPLDSVMPGIELLCQVRKSMFCL